jgi:hypothetical protein
MYIYFVILLCFIFFLLGYKAGKLKDRLILFNQLKEIADMRIKEDILLIKRKWSDCQ